MARVSEILNGICNVVKDTLHVRVNLLDDAPATFNLGEAYVVSPDDITIDHMIGSGSFMEFDVQILIPTKSKNSDRQQTASRGLFNALDNTWLLLSEGFARMKIVEGGNVYGVNHGVGMWESNGFIYVVSEITIHIRAYIDL